MTISIDVIEILNSAYQLSALPIGESIQVRLTAMPDMSSIDRYVSIIQVDSSQDIPNLTSTPFIIADEFEYKTVECNYSVEDYHHLPDDDTYILTVSPKKLLRPQSQFYLAVHKNLAPISYEVNKTISLGPSDIKIIVSDTGSSDDVLYTIVITSQSNLANSQHIIGYDIYENNVLKHSQIKNIRENNLLELNELYTAKFNADIPYLVGETFEITLLDFERLGESKTQAFSTIIESSVIENPETISHRLDLEDVINFYENSHWNDAFTSPAQQPPANAVQVSYRFTYPNKLRIEFDKEVLIASIVPGSFVVDISYAFNNYMLPQMGLYSESKKYIITCTIVPKTITTTQRIDIVITEDSSNLVPLNDKFIVVIA